MTRHLVDPLTEHIGRLASGFSIKSYDRDLTSGAYGTICAWSRCVLLGDCNLVAASQFLAVLRCVALLWAGNITTSTDPKSGSVSPMLRILLPAISSFKISNRRACPICGFWLHGKRPAAYFKVPLGQPHGRMALSTSAVVPEFMASWTL